MPVQRDAFISCTSSSHSQTHIRNCLRAQILLESILCSIKRNYFRVYSQLISSICADSSRRDLLLCIGDRFTGILAQVGIMI